MTEHSTQPDTEAELVQKAVSENVYPLKLGGIVSTLQSCDDGQAEPPQSHHGVCITHPVLEGRGIFHNHSVVIPIPPESHIAITQHSDYALAGNTRAQQARDVAQQAVAQQVVAQLRSYVNYYNSRARLSIESDGPRTIVVDVRDARDDVVVNERGNNLVAVGNIVPVAESFRHRVVQLLVEHLSRTAPKDRGK